MNNQTNNDSKLPLVIIGLVLAAAIGGGWWFYSSSKSQTTVKPTNANKPAPTPDSNYRNAPPGAQPANTLGAPTAPVKIEEFADYQCPTCASMHKTMKEINSLYSGRVQFTYRSFPLTQIHKNAYDAALAAEAAGQQGKYWAMQDQLFNNQQAWSNSADARKLFEEYASKIGLDVAKFQADMAGVITKTRVDADTQRGRAIPISGTPTIYINGYKLAPEQMEINALRQIIDAELQKAANQTQPAQPVGQPAANSANSTGK